MQIFKQGIAMCSKTMDKRIQDWNTHYSDELFPINTVGIETMGGCTRRCPFCVLDKISPRSGSMALDTIEKIASELATLEFSGGLRLHFYNEPLLDSRLEKILPIIRKHLPHNFIRLTSNGDLITNKRIASLFSAGVSEIILSQYSAAHHEQTVAKLSSVDKEHSARIKFVKFYDKFEATNRAGQINTQDVNTSECTIVPGASQSGCDRVEMYFDFEGNCYPYCHTFNTSYTIGNINDASLLDIYQNSKDRYFKHFTGQFEEPACLSCIRVSKNQPIHRIG